MNILWNHLKKIFGNAKSCGRNCYQGRRCTCYNTTVGECIIELHNLARNIEYSEESLKVRMLANELAKIGNRLREKIQILEFRPEKNYWK